MRKRKFTKEQLIEACSSSKSKREILFKIGLKETGGNYKQLEKYCKEEDIKLDHLIGQGWRKGSTKPIKERKKLEEILVENNFYNSYRLKNRLIKENIFEHKCYKCGLKEWLGQIIPIELEHINGIKEDNRLENLTLLCPNCHAQTDTYRGKNIRR
jgi:Zn finger protein HypA/HybF involved in hydrogenase expression